MTSNHSKKIVLHLLKNFEFVNMNQIAQRLKISVGSVFKNLKTLEEKSIVSYQKLGNAKFYTLNFTSDETKKLCELLLIEERRALTGYSQIYAQEIVKCEYASILVLFGSILSKTTFNDVDVLFVAEKVKEINTFCLNVSKIRTKPVVPLILHEKDLISEMKNKKDSILSIIKTGVVLKGESEYVTALQRAKS